MIDGPLVSIITPSFNSSKYIGSTIESIQNQTYSNWELLITDDCSTDNSREIIKKYAADDKRIRLLNLEQNSGAGAARNHSIKNARGVIIAFCDSDDQWYPEKLEIQLRFMDDNNCALSYSSYNVSDEEGSLIGSVKCLKSINYRQILRDNGIGCLTAMYDTRKIGKCYFPIIRKRQDWCLWIDIIKRERKAYGIPKPLAIYRVRKDSISSNKIEMLRHNFNVYHQVLKFNRVTSLLMLGGYFLPYYFYKKLKQKLAYKKRNL